jgi:hypothetical protein
MILQVLLLIMSELSSDDYDLTAYSKSRVLIAKLVCKVFLVYLPELSKHEDMFLDVSSSIFESLSKFSKLDRDIASSLVGHFFPLINLFNFLF